ncbi:NrfD/PsrC family molybdoenzyme membrane anchor subunit [Pasteurella multocida]|uniref:NrfD/PsrC family molybdoenzyme membrane anchor subunit n=1 Tax=Pasteurella multocida TaxID=747 RepID=UPI002CDCF7AF|nr:NrfD/PsrC family molybdoenzyme membrane anchor subunit [Pasteurella multocida]MEB3480975.1 NrfD/PsrC family molybdoenzyme membrane anchor subunit [Pasteurella multocida]
MIIREIVVEPQAIAWLPWAVSYFFFIGLAFSSVFVGLLIHKMEKNVQHEFIAIIVALSCAIVAPIALTADLHQPSRIVNFYLHLTPWSWMAWGAIFLPLFTLAAVGYFLCLLRQAIPQQHLPRFLNFLYWGQVNLHRWTTFFRVFAFLSALSILIYTTMEVFVVEARPLWHQSWLMPLILFSVLPSTLLLCRFLIAVFSQHKIAGYLSTLTFISLILFIGTLLGVYFSSEQTALQLTQLWQLSDLPMLVLVVLGGLLLGTYLTASLWLQGMMALLALLLTWVVRWILLIEVQRLAKYNALINPYELTWHIDGAIGILSVFSLWLCISIVLWWVFSAALAPLHLTGGNHE